MISIYSLEHIIFLKKEKRKKIIIISFQLLILISFLFIWQLAADKNWINTFITSSPKEIIKTIIRLNDSNLWEHIWVTVYETLISFVLGTGLGILIATILWWNKYLQTIFDPYLTILNSLPKVA